MSLTANVVAAVKIEARATVPPRSAVDCAEIVQTVVELCVIELMSDIRVNVKSTLFSYDKVAQLIASLPVTVNRIVDELELPALRAKVTVGAVRSAATVVVVAVVVVGATVVVVVVVGATVVAGVETAIHFKVFATLTHTSFLPPTVTVFPATVHFAPSLLTASAGDPNTPRKPTAIANATSFFPMPSGYRPS